MWLRLWAWPVPVWSSQKLVAMQRRRVKIYVGKLKVYYSVPSNSCNSIHGNKDGTFLPKKNSDPLTKACFIHHVRGALQAVGLPYEHFAGHYSFRIGAATTAAKAEVEVSNICMIGWWNSTTFLAYIRTPREELAQLSNFLVRQ